jgi:hypothetical protein
MKIRVTIVDDKGIVYEGAADLQRAPSPSKKSKDRAKVVSTTTSSLSFSLNARAFMNTYGKGKSGSQRFTLLVAHMAKGKIAAQISLERIESTWNRMKAVMGGPFNAAHTTRAKERGWIDSPRRGMYELSNDWKEAMRTS